MRYYVELLIEFLETGLFFYAVFLMSSYVILSIIALYSLKLYKRTEKVTNYRDILPSIISPKISLIAPAYNEQLNIVENIKSLMSLHYANYEVIIINDGSKDNTLKDAIEAYDLVLDESYLPKEVLPHKKIRGIYRSQIPHYKNLILLDKENGGKADALNAGISESNGTYVACIDVDCILEQDSLLRLVKPFLNSKERVIATGGVIRIVNSCVVEDGAIKKVTVPKSLYARAQVVEYLRAFLLSRVAWGKINGLMLISGAFGMFDKEILIKSGGYNPKTVGEDMELVVRMTRYMVENDKEYRVDFIPDPLCWTEAPEDTTILGRQRNRWTRGTIETLGMHKKLFFNPRYGKFGMISYPYWFFFEYLAPLLEALGIVWFIVATILGLINWPFFLLVTLFVYLFAQMINMLAIFTEEYTYHKYNDIKDIGKLAVASLIEPFFYHPYILYSAIKGHIDFYKGSHGWGEMTRKGVKGSG
jgi:cellulose synthase/poly-beta-1,6-N-acetylglucosamine synthase-like glycosyltransferase